HGTWELWPPAPGRTAMRGPGTRPALQLKGGELPVLARLLATCGRARLAQRWVRPDAARISGQTRPVTDGLDRPSCSWTATGRGRGIAPEPRLVAQVLFVDLERACPVVGAFRREVWRRPFLTDFWLRGEPCPYLQAYSGPQATPPASLSWAVGSAAWRRPSTSSGSSA